MARKLGGAGHARTFGESGSVEARGVQGLEDVVAGGGEKARLRGIRVFRQRLGANELGVETLELAGALLDAPFECLIGDRKLLLRDDARGHIGIGRHHAAIGKRIGPNLDHGA